MSEGDHTTIPLVEPEISAIPEELKAHPQWVCWTLDDEARASLFDPRNHTAASGREPDTWGTFDQTLAALQAYTYDGIGFVFSEDDPYFGLSLVNVRDPETQTVEPWATAIVQFFNSYTEIAPSGRDLHIIARGSIAQPLHRSRTYADGQTRRFVIRDHAFHFPITGHRLAGTPSTIAERQEAITRFCERVEGLASQQAAEGQAQTAARPPLETLADILATEFPPMRWAIPELLPEGCILLGGRPKMGKSMLALNIAIAVATGGTALGHYQVEAGDVLYYDLEGNRRRLQTRARKMLPAVGEGALPTRLIVKFIAPQIDSGLQEEIRAWRNTHPEARLVVIDILAKVRPAKQSRNPYQDDHNLIAALQMLASEIGLTLLIVHHTRKAPAEDPFDEMNATTGLFGAADGGMILRRAREEDNAILHVAGRDLEENIALALHFDRPTALWSAVGGAEQFQRTQARQQVLEVLQQYGIPMTPKSIAEALGLPEPTIRQRCLRMANDGDLVNVGEGHYRVLRHCASRSHRNVCHSCHLDYSCHLCHSCHPCHCCHSCHSDSE